MRESPFLLYKEIVPTSSVCLSTFFTPYASRTTNSNDEVLFLGDEYLFTAAAAALNIYKIIRKEDTGESFFLHAYHSTLFGRAQDIQVYKPEVSQNVNSREQLIVLSLDTGKFCILRFDPATASLQTMNMFNSQENALGAGAMVKGNKHGLQRFGGTGLVPYFTIDSFHSIACSVLYGSELYFFPLSGNNITHKDRIDEDGNLNNKDQEDVGIDYIGVEDVIEMRLKSPFLIDLYGSLELGGVILDVLFLSGFDKPTIAVLQESELLPLGHAKARLHTCTVSALTIDIDKSSATLLWQQQNLPHDSVRLLMLPSSPSCCRDSVLLVTMNALLIVSNQGSSGLATNGFAGTSVAPHIYLQSWDFSEGVELDGSLWLESGMNSCIASLKDGRLFSFELTGLDQNDAILNVSKIQFQYNIVCQTPRASSVCVSPSKDLWFLGSRLACCSLVKVKTKLYSKTSTQFQNDVIKTVLDPSIVAGVLKQDPMDNSEESGPPAKKARKGTKSRSKKESSTEKTEIAKTKTALNEEEYLYGNNIGQPAELSVLGSTVSTEGYELVVADVINVMGTIIDAKFCKGDDTFDSILTDSSIEWNKQGQRLDPAKAGSAAAYIAERELKATLELSTGLEEQGGLTRVSQGIKFCKIAAKAFPQASTIHTLIPFGRSYSIILMNSGQSCRLFLVTERKKSAKIKTKGDSSNAESSVLIKEATKSASSSVITSAPTVKIGEISPGILVHASSLGLTLLKLEKEDISASESELSEDWNILDRVSISDLCSSDGGCALDTENKTSDNNNSIISADICEGYVSVVSSSGDIFILKLVDFVENSGSKKTKNKNDVKSPELSLMCSRRDAVSENHDSWLENCLPRLLGTKILGSSLYIGTLPHRPPDTSTKKIKKGNSTFTSIPHNSSQTPDQIRMHIDSTAASKAPGVRAAEAGARAKQKARVAAEENFLYGETVCTGAPPASSCITHLVEEKSQVAKEKKMMKKGTSKGRLKDIDREEDGKNDSNYYLCDEAPHVVIWFSDGAMCVLDLHKQETVFYTNDLSLMPQYLCINRYQNESEEEYSLPKNDIKFNNTFTESSDTKSHLRRLHAVRITELGSVDEKNITDRRELSRLCITAIMSSGDIVVYYLPSMNDSKVSRNLSFVKLNHTCISRRYTSEDRRKIDQFRLDAVTEYNGAKAFNKILVSGSYPCVIRNEKGLPRIIPLCLPEIPFENAGELTVCQMRAGHVTGLCTLWSEYTGSAGLLGLYQESPGQQLLPGSNIAYKRIIFGKTVKASVEFVERGEDKTEQELLARKTFVVAVSEEKKKPFVHLKSMTLEEKKLYDRYFPDMDSFCAPDVAIGAPPSHAVRSDSLVLMQSGQPVSSYDFDDNEHIVGCDVVCLATEKTLSLNIGMNRAPSATTGGNRRVFVVASTCIRDPHGEDTPGEGRLILFSLDYRLLQDEDEKKDGTDKSNEEDSDLVESDHLQQNEKQNNIKIGENADEMDEDKDGVPDKIEDPLAIDAAKALAAQEAVRIAKAAAVAEKAKMELKLQMEGGFGGKIQPKLKVEWTGPGPGSVVKGFGEFILSTVDNILYVYKLLPGQMELEQVAFFTANVYIKSVCTIKDKYILISDFRHSVQFLAWNKIDYSITFLGKDYQKCVGLSTSFIRDGSAVGCLLGDDESNIQLLQYNPAKAESKDGTRLLLLADFHLGSDATVMIPHPLYISMANNSNIIGNGKDYLSSQNTPNGRDKSFQQPKFSDRISKSNKRDAVLVGTGEGAIGILIPLDERVYKRLELLQQILSSCVRTVCALNPREYRLHKTEEFRYEKKKGVLDGTLLYQYHLLDAVLQDEVASAMGVNSDVLLDTLAYVDLTSSFF